MALIVVLSRAGLALQNRPMFFAISFLIILSRVSKTFRELLSIILPAKCSSGNFQGKVSWIGPFLKMSSPLALSSILVAPKSFYI